MGPEAKIESAIGKYAKSKGCLYYKFSSPNQRGVPDRILIAPTGIVVFLEVKATGKKPTKLQEREMDRIKANKASATWVDSIEGGCKIIDFICQ